MQARKNLSTLLLQDDKEFKVSVREGSSFGSSSTDLKSKLLGERRDSSSDRYAPSCFSSLRVAMHSCERHKIAVCDRFVLNAYLLL